MSLTRPGVNKVKPKVGFKYSLLIGIFIMVQKGRLMMFSLNIFRHTLVLILRLRVWSQGLTMK